MIQLNQSVTTDVKDGAHPDSGKRGHEVSVLSSVGNIQRSQLPFKVERNGGLSKEKVDVQYVQQVLLGITSENPSGYIELRMNAGGLVQMLIRFPRWLWSYLAIDITHSGEGTLKSENPERLVAVASIMALMVVEIPRELTVQDFEGVPKGQLLVWPNEHREIDIHLNPIALDLANLLNHPVEKDFGVICKILAPESAHQDQDNPESNLIQSHGGNADGRSLFGNKAKTIGINNSRLNSKNEKHHTLFMAQENWAKHLFRAIIQSVERNREAGSGTAAEPHYLVASTMNLWLVDARASSCLKDFKDPYSGDRLQPVGCATQFTDKNGNLLYKTLEDGTRKIEFKITASRHPHTKVMGNYEIFDPRQDPKKKDCLFNAIIYEQKNSLSKTTVTTAEGVEFYDKGDIMYNMPRNQSDYLRYLLGLPMGELVDITNNVLMCKICDIMQVSLEIYHIEDIHKSVKWVNHLITPLFEYKPNPIHLQDECSKREEGRLPAEVHEAEPKLNVSLVYHKHEDGSGHISVLRSDECLPKKTHRVRCKKLFRYNHVDCSSSVLSYRKWQMKSTT